MSRTPFSRRPETTVENTGTEPLTGRVEWPGGGAAVTDPRNGPLPVTGDRTAVRDTARDGTLAPDATTPSGSTANGTASAPAPHRTGSRSSPARPVDALPRTGGGFHLPYPP
ncbi:hypothetical protein ACF1AE_17665 [Streptomyces sp. NPDC014986]|uniref:hypothetical protein n=1 Tax=Streptomyces sp. NPDC014986 TaxID=3364934 RepID=UPI0036F90DE8